MRFSPLCAAALAALSFMASGQAQAAAFGANDLVIYSVATAGASGTASQVTLKEYSTTGTFVQGVTVNGLTASNTATSEGLLTRSADGRYLDFTGYAATAGTAGVAGTTSASVKREIGQADAQGNIAVAAVLDAYSANNIRSVVSLDGSSFYSSGAGTNGGVRYDVGNSSTAVSSLANTRQVNIFNNQLYYSTASGTTGVYALGTGLPTSGPLAGTLIAATASPYGFYFADLDGQAGLDTLYVADDAAGIKKFSLSGSTWTQTGAITGTTGITGLTGVTNGTSVRLYATNTSKLLGIVDSTGFNGTLSGSLTTLATAGAGEAFRGVALAPVPEPETYALMLAGLACLGGAALRKRQR